MIPLTDKRKFKRIPYITILYIFLNTVLFFLFSSNLDYFISNYGFTPGDFNFLNLFTSFFIHLNFLHLLINMWFLWVFGSTLEDKIGHKKFFFFYLLVGFLANVFYFLFVSSNLNIPIVGASGAISGILGAYLILFPKNRLKTFPNLNLYSYLYIILWFVIQLAFYLFQNQDVAYLGHLGGFIVGIILIFFFK